MKGISESVGSTDYLHLFLLVIGYYMLNLAFVVLFVAILTCSTLVFIYLPFFGFLALPMAYLQTVLVSTTICNSMVKGTDFILFTRIYGVTFARKKLPELSKACETVSFTPFVYRRSHRLRGIFSRQFYFVSLPQFFIFVIWYVSIAFFFLFLMIVPVVGPIIVNMMPCSPGMGFYYFEPYFVDVLHLNSRQLSDVYYRGFAKWLLYSMSSGLLESIPILSGFFIGTNVVGASLWIIKERNDQEDPILPPLTPVQPIEPAEESHAPPVQQSISHVNPP
ncbi:Outer spore wall protein lds2 [Saccharomyces pastorianus]|uniref:Outer spore wall protein lds2 n=1 Tax=Saccharomyces pastorianus TaxID=27292 RepID=A0A6C1EF74_SACPS|nr:Outer spore wall protein lds2 [Saccharomyces pastorianus]